MPSAGSHVGRRPAGVALHAGDAGMARAGQFSRADVQVSGLSGARPLEGGIGMAAQAIAIRHPLGVVDLADFVRLMAVDARRDEVRLLLPQLAADHLAVYGLDLSVALRAGLGNVLFRNRGLGIRVGTHVVRGMATGADRGNGQAFLEEANAMNAVLVILQDIGLRHDARLADLGVFAVTAAAEARHVDGGGGRLHVGRGQDVVRAVTELAVGSIRVVLRRLPAVDAGGVLALLVAMAQAAVDAGQLFRMRHFFDIAVAGDALEGRMGGRFQGGRVEARGHSGLAFPDARSGIVAACAVLGMQLRRRLAAEASGQQGRNGSEAE